MLICESIRLVSLLGGEVVARHQAFAGGVTADGDDPDFVDEVLPAGLDHDGRLEHGDLGACGVESSQFGFGQGADAGPDDVSQALHTVRMAEDFGTELAAVDRAVVGDEVLAEGGDNLLEGVGARFVGLVAEDVGVDCGGAEFLQLFDDGGLA